MIDLVSAAIEYENASVEVGCAEHADPTCLCDVIVTTPTEVRYSLGNDKRAVLFSQTVDQQIPAVVHLADHLTALAALYEAAAPSLPNARAVTAREEKAEYEYHYERKWPGDDNLSDEDLYWIRKDIPSTWAAAATDLHGSTIRAYRRRHGIVVTDRHESEDWTFSQAQREAQQLGRLTVQRGHNDFLASAETQAVLRDESLTADEAAKLLGRSVSYVRNHRATLGVKSSEKAAKGQDKRFRVFTDYERSVLLDVRIGTMEGARLLNMVPSNFKRHRTKLFNEGTDGGSCAS